MNMARGRMEYDLKLTNMEVRFLFEQMIEGWFGTCRQAENVFLKALLAGDLDAMNESMNELSLGLFSSFDTGKNPSRQAQPERFYHGFVLGMLVELRDSYTVTSNRESGLGRYDIVLEPKNGGGDAIIIEFKVVHARKKETLEDAVKSALAQIKAMRYEAALVHKGIPAERIRKYGFAFEGCSVLIG